MRLRRIVLLLSLSALLTGCAGVLRQPDDVVDCVAEPTDSRCVAQKSQEEAQRAAEEAHETARRAAEEAAKVPPPK